MIALRLRRSAVAIALLPLALGLAACDKKADDAGGLSGEPVAKIAAPAGKAWADVVAETPDGGVLLGNPAAPIKVIEYGSLSCPHCAKLAQDGFAKLRDDYIASGRVSLEFRSFAIHPQDVPLTLLARCGGLETYFPQVEQIYANFDALNAPLADQAVQVKANAAMQAAPEQRMNAISEALGYTQFFAARGIAVEQARSCLANEAKAQQIAGFAQKYTEEGITGTPALLLNGANLNTTEWNVLEAALQKAGAR